MLDHAEYTLTLLDRAARDRLEDIVATRTPRYTSEFTERYVQQGREEGREEGLLAGEAKSLLKILQARGIDLTDAERRRIAECTDPDTLDLWLERALTAATSRELFS